ncbi:hypothetical protein HNR27_001222 [Ornithinibacillus bavariensis]
MINQYLTIEEVEANCNQLSKKYESMREGYIKL